MDNHDESHKSFLAHSALADSADFSITEPLPSAEPFLATPVNNTLHCTDWENYQPPRDELTDPREDFSFPRDDFFFPKENSPPHCESSQQPAPSPNYQSYYNESYDNKYDDEFENYIAEKVLQKLPQLLQTVMLNSSSLNPPS